MHSQEIISSSTTIGRYGASLIGNGAEDAKPRIQIFADIHDGCNIATAVAIVGSRPDSND